MRSLTIFSVGLMACVHAGVPHARVESIDAQKFYQLELPTVRARGEAFSFSQLRGKRVVVHLFATWSPLAQIEGAKWVQLYDQLRAQNVMLVTVALDAQREFVEAHVDFLGQPFVVLMGAAQQAALADAVGPTQVVPRTLVIDADGKLLQEHLGETDFPALQSAIASSHR